MNLRRSLVGLALLTSGSFLVHCDSTSALGNSPPGSNVYGNNGDDDSGPSTTDGGSNGETGAGDDDDSGSNPNRDAGGQALSGDGCAGGTCLNKECKPYKTAHPIEEFPETGFTSPGGTYPDFIPDDVIIPTFDDVPDGTTDPSDPGYKVFGKGNYTKDILAYFDSHNMHVDFFINTNNWCGDVMQDPDCQGTIINILKTQNPGNHTIHHAHLGTPNTKDSPGCGDATSCEAELLGVESVISGLSNQGRPHLTRFRAPFGEPYQLKDSAKLAFVAPTVAKFAVEVDWDLDSNDWSCDDSTATGPCFTAADIVKNVTTLIGTHANGSKPSGWGILLMHGTFPWTRDAVPLLFGPDGEFKQRGFRLGTVEDAICWKYGKHSWEIVQQLTSQTRSAN